MCCRNIKIFTLFTGVLYQLFLNVNSQPPVDLVTSLSDQIAARTELYYCSVENVHCAELLKHSAKPKLLLTTNHSVQLRGHYHEHMLVVAILEENSPTALEQLRGLKRTLAGWHHTHILFVAVQQGEDCSLQATEKTTTEWRWIFEWCWTQGLINALLFKWCTFRNATSTTELLTYTHFPSLRIYPTTLSEYLRVRREKPNFLGMPFRVGVGNNPPRALIYTDEHGKRQQHGVAPASLRFFAGHYNATLDFIELAGPGNSTYQTKFCIDMLKAGQLDICADGFPYTNLTPITQTIFLHKAYLLVRYPQPIERYRYFIAPFSSLVWRILIVTFASLILLTAVISRQQLGVWNFDYFFLEVLKGLLMASIKLSYIRGHVRRLLCILLTTCGFVVSSIYLTCLCSILTTDVYERQIKSFEDLHTLNITVPITEFNMKSIKFNGVPNSVVELFELMPQAEIIASRKTLDPRYAQFLYYDKCLLQMYRQRFLLRPRATLLNTPVQLAAGGIPIKHNFPFDYLLNLDLIRILDYGFYWHFLTQSLEESMKYSRYHTFQTEYRELTPLNMVYFQMPGLLLSCGFALALTSLVGEILLHRLHHYWRGD